LISLGGSQVTSLALPLTAITILHATASQMGVQSMFWTSGSFLAALFAGPIVDRLPRRRILIGADIGRGLIIASVPFAAIVGVLSMEQIYIVVLLFSVLTIVYDIANTSFLPELIQRKHLVEGNSALQASRSIMAVAGPGIAGVVVQAITAPIAILIDAISYVLSALLVGLIRVPEPSTPSGKEQRAFWKEIGDGFGLVLRNPVLRPLAATSATFVFFLQFFSVLRILYLTRALGIGPAAIGIISAVGSAGAFLGALLAARSARHLGLRPVMVGGVVLSGIGSLMTPLAAGVPIGVLLILMLGALLDGIGGTVYNINALSLRQAITHDEVQGRVNAAMRFFAIGTTPISALLSGMLGETIGVRTVLVIAGVGEILACLWLLLSDIRTWDDIDEGRVESISAQ
jgi:MFS family permease